MRWRWVNSVFVAGGSAEGLRAYERGRRREMDDGGGEKKERPKERDGTWRGGDG